MHKFKLENLVNKIDFKILLGLIILGWVILQLTYALPDLIANDWVSWRQADTQTIARNFLKPGSNIFYPQINWGGTGPGYAETEFQLYTFLVTQIMKTTGESVLPGQLLSLLFIVLTTIVIFFTLLYYFQNQYAALFGAVAFLVSNGAVHLSTSIQPDSLCILFYSLSLFTFLIYLADQKNSLLVLWVSFSLLAGLVKPLALNVGIIQFFIIFFLHRHLLKSPKIWIGWILIVLITLSFSLFSYSLYLTYGNTFGILGGESKFPTLKGLMVFIHYPKLVYMTIVWGLGPIGLLAFLYIVYKKKIKPMEWALIIGNAAAILVPMRYTVNSGFSPHYYIFTALLGAWLAALAYQLFDENISSPRIRKYMPAVAAVLICVTYSGHLYARMNPAQMHFDPNVTKLGYKLKEVATPNSYAIVRSIAGERERSTWGNRINNFEDPRIFYIANIKGWALPFDSKGYECVKKYVEQGAEYYVEPFKKPVDTELNVWLQSNAVLIFQNENGRIYKFVKQEKE